MSGIKLFGKTILLRVDDFNATSHDDEIISEGELTQSSKNRDDFTNSTVDHELVERGISDDTKIQDVDKDPSENSGTEEKVVKKPDKILPCPCCNSMATKFCYYNNYNVNQPRHFCKKCQRYWTVGGTMRNVPVGSGRRKNKSYRHITVPDVLQGASGSVLAFRADKLLCDSMASRLDLAEKSHNSIQNGFEQRMLNVCRGKEIGNDRSSQACSSTTSNSTKNGNNSTSHDLSWKKFQAFPPQWHHFRGSLAYLLWVFPCHFILWDCTMGSPWTVPWLSPPPSSASPTLWKHSRDESRLNPSNLGKEDTFQDKDGEKSVVIPKTLRIDDLDEAAKSSSTLGIKNDSANGARLFKAFNSKVNE